MRKIFPSPAQPKILQTKRKAVNSIYFFMARVGLAEETLSPPFARAVSTPSANCKLHE